MHVRDRPQIRSDATESESAPDGRRAVAEARRDGVCEAFPAGRPRADLPHLRTHANRPGAIDRGVQ